VARTLPRMANFTGSDDLRGSTFVGVDLTGTRFVESDLTGLVMRGVEVAQADIDAPWLVHGGYFRINGVDVIAYVESELDRRFPGRAGRRAADPEGLRVAWAALEAAWTAALARAASLPAGSVDVSVDGEWSFAQTVRHLVHATDIWLRKGVLELDDPFHPLGLADLSAEGEVPDAAASASYDDVLAARAARVGQVRDVIAEATPALLAEARRNPHDPDHAETVLSCLHVILEEEWEHLRFALRDLDAVEAGIPVDPSSAPA
jgi:DinB family protein/pentapeptide repeat protein